MSIQNTNYGLIKKWILDKKTILFLGHGASIRYKNSQRQNSFFQKLKDAHPSQIEAYHQQDGFLVFHPESDELLLIEEIKEFYEQDFSNLILEKIAEIPFHLIITVTPDLTLHQIFRQKQFDFQSQFYEVKKKKTIAEDPTKDRPLLYHLLGSVEKDESLITSHFDLFNLLKSVYGDKNLPDKLTNAFNAEQTKNIIFLGFDFEKWYFQLLLNLLEINYKRCVRYATRPKSLNEEFQTLITSHFRINFVNDDIDEFVNQLYQQFTKDELRKPSEKTTEKKRIYHKKNILKFLKAFNAIDFDTFCLLNFEDVHNDFTPEQGQSTRLNLLLAFLEKRQQYDQFLTLAQEENPIQFKNYMPYYDETD